MKLLRFETRRCGVLGRTLLPLGAFGGLTDGRDVGEGVAAQLLVTPWTTALVVRLAIFLAWYAPLFCGFGLHTFGGLDGDNREALLERLLKSPNYAIRQTLMVLKLNVCFALISDVKVLAYLGAYDLGERPSPPQGSDGGGLVTLGNPAPRAS